jgi:hypothetical protein
MVNASTLQAGENLTFDGSAETNGSFFIYGGKGVDTLTGGRAPTCSSSPRTGGSPRPTMSTAAAARTRWCFAAITA